MRKMFEEQKCGKGRSDFGRGKFATYVESKCNNSKNTEGRLSSTFRKISLFTLAIALFLFILIISMSQAFALQDLMALQGNAFNGTLPIDGNIEITVWDQPTGGSLIYDSSSDYNNAVIDGKFDIMLGDGSQQLTLDYGKIYYMDMSINGQDLDFNGSERRIFQSNVGYVNGTLITSQNLMNVNSSVNAQYLGGISATLLLNNDSALNSRIDSLNGSKASVGVCPAGEFVQNTTVGGVQCGTPNVANPFNQNLNTGDNVQFKNITATNISATNIFGTLNWTYLVSIPSYVKDYSGDIIAKLDASDQRYNDTVSINTKLNTTDQRYNDSAINSTLNIQSLGFNTTVQLKTYFDTLYATFANIVSSVGNWSAERTGVLANISNSNLTATNANTLATTANTTATQANNTAIAANITATQANTTATGVNALATTANTTATQANITATQANTTATTHTTLISGIQSNISSIGNWSAERTGVLANISNSNLTATNANTLATTANTTATQANNTAIAANITATQANTTATGVNALATTANTTATQANNTAIAANITATQANTTATTHTTLITGIQSNISSIGNWSAERTGVLANISNSNLTATNANTLATTANTTATQANNTAIAANITATQANTTATGVNALATTANTTATQANITATQANTTATTHTTLITGIQSNISSIGNWSAVSVGVLANISYLNTSQLNHSTLINGIQLNLSWINATSWSTSSTGVLANISNSNLTATNANTLATTANSTATQANTTATQANNTATTHTTLISGIQSNLSSIGNWTQDKPNFASIIYVGTIGNWSAVSAGVLYNITNANATALSSLNLATTANTTATQANTTATTHTSLISGMQSNISSIGNWTQDKPNYASTVYVGTIGNWSAVSAGILANISNSNLTATMAHNELDVLNASKMNDTYRAGLQSNISWLNTTKGNATTGICPAGKVAANTTTTGVDCVNASGITAAGDNGEILFNNNSVIQGSSNAIITNEGFLNLQNISALPPTPTSGATMMSENVGNYTYVGYMIPAGRPVYLQPSIRDDDTTWCVPPHSGVAATAMQCSGMTLTANVGTLSNPAPTATTFLSQLTLSRDTSTGVANNGAEQKGAQLNWWRGNSATVGGFLFAWKGAWSTIPVLGRGCVGMFGTVAALPVNADCNTTINSIYAGFSTGYTTLRICSNDGAGTATCPVDCGVNFPVGNTTAGQQAVYLVNIYTQKNGAGYWVNVQRQDSAVADCNAFITADIPANTQFLSWHVFCNNGGTASACVVDTTKVYIGKDN